MDSVAHSRRWHLWRKVGYPFWFSPQFSGVELTEIAHEMEKYLSREVKNIPPMKVNMLFQYKRPQYITMSTGAEWHLWNRKYFRYDLYAQQHALLSHIEKKFGNDAVVLYAAPSVLDVSELVKLKRVGSIIDSTNFRRACELDGHHRNTYIRAGTYSQACSEPERIDNFSLIEMIETVEPSQLRDNDELIVNFAKKIDSAMSEVKGLGCFKTAFEDRMNEFRDYELEQFDIIYAMLTMAVFREITGCQWLIPFDGRKSA
ncbi:hypothetical protein SAMN05216571_1132 [Onishia taeanensis]|uniref:Uncharacterized protein n=1 Tax=Onishia taeanensis TaxID=284577 RepID=A0A1G7U4Q5_9GAMM|nr:hypothetical protein [Halomonas taeanensis]SDG42417.1 hypothetical protein SAMN05216571_1132 [Halomonas taeanensis]